jgi:hypothetical protein
MLLAIVHPAPGTHEPDARVADHPQMSAAIRRGRMNQQRMKEVQVTGLAGGLQGLDLLRDDMLAEGRHAKSRQRAAGHM